MTTTIKVSKGQNINLRYRQQPSVKKSEAVDSGLELVIEILKKEPDDRAPKDISHLLKNTANVTFFTQESPEVHEQCLRYMTYTHIPKNFNVFNAGEVGTTFYVLLKGSVSVNILVPLDKGNPNEKIWREVRVLESGAAFGELALINNKPRAATIRCREDCHFAVLEKEYYNTILSNIFELKLWPEL